MKGLDFLYSYTHSLILPSVTSQTDYEGQVKTLMQYIDPTIDGIVIAGGDGTVQEVCFEH